VSAKADDTLAQHISFTLSHGPAWVLVTGNTQEACLAFLDKLSRTLTNSSHVLKICIPSESAHLPERISSELGLSLLSAPSQHSSAEKGNTYLLCQAEDCCRQEDFEQLRQLSNLYPSFGHLGIVLCGEHHMLNRLPSAIRQRLVSVYRLDGFTATRPRRAILGGLFVALAIAAIWIAYLSFSSNNQTLPQPSSNTLATSLNPEPVLVRPAPLPEPEPLTHVFQTEDEAEASLRSENPGLNKPPDPDKPPLPLPR